MYLFNILVNLKYNDIEDISFNNILSLFFWIEWGLLLDYNNGLFYIIVKLNLILYDVVFG